MTKEQFYDRFEKMWHDLIGSPAQHTLRYSNCSGMFREADEEIGRLNGKIEQLENTLLKFAEQRSLANEPRSTVAIQSPSALCPLLGCKVREAHEHEVIE